MDNFFQLEMHEAHAETLYPRRDVIQSTLCKKRDHWLVACFWNDGFTHNGVEAAAEIQATFQANSTINSLCDESVAKVRFKANEEL